MVVPLTFPTDIPAGPSKIDKKYEENMKYEISGNIYGIKL